MWHRLFIDASVVLWRPWRRRRRPKKMMTIFTRLRTSALLYRLTGKRLSNVSAADPAWRR
jgi:hypothetical protein